ncbi:ABC transporter ATP-binding protein [Acholeplasma granularum]|uniref:ABC transporter ATP-binding protein n=1 Tax=Acholeplasma granularum TaxID=264635 RepID=UPI0004AD371E|nr:ABC transporter ATP-binding protein [Acholeplasma granularum]
MAMMNKDTVKRRRTQLKLNYLIGLEYEYKKKLEEYKSKKLIEIDRYFTEDTNVANKRLEGIHHNSEIITKKLEQYDKKAYWKRRRFKNKNKSMENLDSLLSVYDGKALEDRNEYSRLLGIKYSNLTYTEDEKSKFSKIIEKQTNLRKARIEKMNVKFEKLNIKTINLIDKINKKQEKFELLIKELNDKINERNLTTLKEEKQLLVEIDNQLVQKNLSEKQKIELTHKKESLENKIAIYSDGNIQLSVRGLKMYFGGIKAVNDLSFEVRKGEIFGLIGPNGAGKTTVFNCITQFYKSTGGSIYFRNKENDIVDLNKLQTHDIIHEGIARSFQNVELIWELTVLDNLLVAGHSLLLTDYLEHMVNSNRTKREEMVLRTKGYKILKDLKIEEYAFRSPYGLPYGVLKKVELARTLMTDPSLIILDEPAAGLNDHETIDLANVIKEINEKYKVTIFLVEHDMGLVMSICERVCAISFGKKLALDVPREIQLNHDVRVAYLGEEDDE